MPKTIIIGDPHFKHSYGNADAFADRREAERQSVEDAVIAAASGCDDAVVLGDTLDSRSPHPEAVRRMASFLSRMLKAVKGDIHILVGNHDGFADGSSAFDFLREIADSRIRIHSSVVTVDVGGRPALMVPYLRRYAIDASGNADPVSYALARYDGQWAVFAHHAFSGCMMEGGFPTDKLNEPVLPKDGFGKAMLFGGHIHKPQDVGRIRVVGSLMNEAIGDSDTKRVLIADGDDVTEVFLPGRKLYRLVDPTPEQVAAALSEDTLVKVVANEGDQFPDAEKLIVTYRPKQDGRRRVAYTDDFSIDNLLKLYAETNKKDHERLVRAYRKLTA